MKFSRYFSLLFLSLLLLAPAVRAGIPFMLDATWVAASHQFLIQGAQNTDGLEESHQEFSEAVFVELSHTPADGFIVCPLDMTPAMNWLGIDTPGSAEFFYEERKIDALFVPGDFPNRGTLVAVLPDDVPKGKPLRLRLENAAAPQPAGFASGSLLFDTQKQGGLPSAITFSDGKTLETLQWLDRLHNPQMGGWTLSNTSLEQIVNEPFLNVVQVTAEFKQGTGVLLSKPAVKYQWFIFPQRELVYVTVSAQQETPAEWKEKHFLELHIADGSFPHWFGDDKSGTFTGTKESQTFSRYSGFLDDDNNIIAAIAPGTILYDGLNDFGPYLMPRGNSAWEPWTETKYRTSAWYWIGDSSEPAKTLQSAHETVMQMPRAEIVIPALDETVKDWRSAALNDMFLTGKIESKEELERLRSTGKLPKDWFEIENGGLGMIFEVKHNEERGFGVGLLSLVETNTKTILSAREPVPLFTAELLDKETGKTVTINSESGWNDIREQLNSKDGSHLVFQGAPIPEAGGLRVALIPGSFNLPPGWWWDVIGVPDRYEFRKVNYPQIALRNLGPNMKTFYPHASGVVTENPVGKELRWQGTYPGGWCSMPWTATYDETKKTGLYLAMHDNGGAVKNIRVDADSATDSLVIRFEHPLPLKGDSFIAVSGAVMKPLHGDWFDAAVIYRQWMWENAEWYPREKLGPDGRTDTPQWMKELSVWALSSDSPQKMPETMRKFTDALGIPTAVHWYNWHQIPFDNDYPHFFPTNEGFSDAVAEIQKNGDCFVMPYINGRLWDTRDKKMEDFQFTSLGLPGATKREDGTPYIETYGSKESDGSPVYLAAMCPATDVWKEKVTEIVQRLINECGVAGVYVDQVAAAEPQLCFDTSHGHPLSGGDWWNRAYWEMFEKIRNEIPKERMLTTECNAEPFVNIFDGYLTWHFQYQNQVPAFAAVYGGAVQMFGRAYRGGSSQVLADRMKLAEQLVYGEQIGWMEPSVVNDERRFPFFKEIVQTRYKYRDYFYKGEMIRPPKLLDEIPTVTADWQWSGEWNITAEAVQTGAWRKKDETGKTTSAVFFFVNVSEEPITSRVAVRLDEIGLESNLFDAPLTFAPGTVLAVEVLP